MGLSKEYYLRLQEEEFNGLDFESQRFLMYLGMEVRHKESDLEKDDKHYQMLKSKRLNAWKDEQEYLFKKRQNEDNVGKTT